MPLTHTKWTRDHLVLRDPCRPCRPFSETDGCSLEATTVDENSLVVWLGVWDDLWLRLFGGRTLASRSCWRICWATSSLLPLMIISTAEMAQRILNFEKEYLKRYTWLARRRHMWPKLMPYFLVSVVRIRLKQVYWWQREQRCICN